MKSNLFLLIALLFLRFGFAQETYHPLVEEDKLWHTLETGYLEFNQSHLNENKRETFIAQSNLPFGLLNTFYHDNKSNHSDFLIGEKDEFINKIENEFPFAKYSKGTIWVMDSNYFYNGNE